MIGGLWKLIMIIIPITVIIDEKFTEDKSDENVKTFKNTPEIQKQGLKSILLADWCVTNSKWVNTEIEEKWTEILNTVKEDDEMFYRIKEKYLFIYILSFIFKSSSIFSGSNPADSLIRFCNISGSLSIDQILI